MSIEAESSVRYGTATTGSIQTLTHHKWYIFYNISIFFVDISRPWIIQYIRYGQWQYEESLYREHTTGSVWYDVGAGGPHDKERRTRAPRTISLPSERETFQTQISATLIQLCISLYSTVWAGTHCQGKSVWQHHPIPPSSHHHPWNVTDNQIKSSTIKTSFLVYGLRSYVCNLGLISWVFHPTPVLRWWSDSTHT